MDFIGASTVDVPSISSSIKFPYSKEFEQAYNKYFDIEVSFVDGMNKMLIEMIKTRKDYFVLLPQFSKTGRMIYFKFDIIVKQLPGFDELSSINYFYEFERCYEV